MGTLVEALDTHQKNHLNYIRTVAWEYFEV